MSNQVKPYLETQIDANIVKEKNTITFLFQKEKIKFNDLSEVHFLSQINTGISRTIDLNEDEVSIQHELLPSVTPLSTKLKEMNESDRLASAYQLVQKVKDHRYSRLNLVVCPDNLVMDQGLTPHFLHFGVKESLPPYEDNPERILQETRAAVAAMMNPEQSFEHYLYYSDTLTLSSELKQVLKAKTLNELQPIIHSRIEALHKKDSEFVKVNKKKWKTSRYVLLGVSICLLPTLLYSLYSLFLLQPKQENIVQAQENFLTNEYSEVVNSLEPYDIDDIPKVTQYQLALSYIINESLTDEQKESVRNTISLQSDPRYYEYWIHIGRGEAEQALEVARYLEDRDLLMYGILKRKEQVKADSDLESEKKQQMINDLEQEFEEYERELNEKQEKQPQEETTQDNQKEDEKKQNDQKKDDK
ncbi:type VII secretion protein EssB [Pseudalkalibacillus hwajinpoensis]|uniref:Type VII secretion protein EssB n=1 Tax=Guptibacillus hwajinpoensis TaxID=208199 RepID=A0A4U1MFQ3_9BACL|nr:type VII secretion protein EssB [Pseudalkalibacillus hwajinpoensis]TKD69202.1 type VII secretion protein EssB [Pseudalkalibacillus hwajinpoensis]